MAKYDVAIVGAGPAGLNCAKILGDAGKKVLLVEKNKVIGPKVCAGGLTGKDLKYLKLPKELLEFEFKRIFFHTRFLSTKIETRNTLAYTIDRKDLGQWQLSQINRKNVKVLTSTTVAKINQTTIELENGEEIGFDCLVGADGSNSIVRKFLKISSEKMAMAFHYLVPTDKYHNFEVFYESRFFGPGYAWIFPHRGFASVGCGSDPKLINAKKLKDNFQKWARKRKVDLTDGRYEAFPINCDFRGYQFNNIFLVGDAAGMASAFTGEGIYQALISGEEVARLITNPRHKATKLQEVIWYNERHWRAFQMVSSWGMLRGFCLEALSLLARVKSFRESVLKKVF